MLNTITVGEKISEARKNKNLSQAALGELLSISSQAVGKWERGESMPDIITFNRLAQVLGVDLNYFSEDFESVAVPEKGAGLPGIINMSSSNWKDADFSGLGNLNGKFNNSNIVNCKFVGSDLSETMLRGNNVADCDFSHSDLSKSKLQGSNVSRCNFTNADMTGALIKGSNFARDILTGAVLNRTEFKSSALKEIVFEGEMTDCSFIDCKYSKVEFRGVTFRGCFFKNGNPKRITFTDCRADNLTYAFLKSAKADLTNITLI
ncbi:hypothetical protein FACS1894202_00300 [Clostridia bacterium]|nr:hypothetical protein FACS1894202_00300 [Clostridia bacterium]